MATLNEIETCTKTYAFARKELAVRVQELEDEIAQLKKRHMNGIKKAVEVAKTYQSRLHAAIEESPENFKKPRTVVLYGIKVGYQKGKGEIVIENPEHTIKLLKKCVQEEDWERYIKTSESLIKTTLAQLPASELRRLGVEMIETGDQVVIKPTDSEVDKLVDALLKDEVKEAREAA